VPGGRGAPAQALLAALGTPDRQSLLGGSAPLHRLRAALSIVAFLTDAFAIRRILDHLGLSPPEAENPPAQREILRVAEHGEGWGKRDERHR